MKKTLSPILSLLTQYPWYDEYSRMTAENYSKPYPRPFPCGSVLLGFDRRNAEMIGYRLDISNGLCEVLLMTNEKKKPLLMLSLTGSFKMHTWLNSGKNP